MSSQSIRPMPRASEQALQITDRLEQVRESIQSLSEQLKQVSFTQQLWMLSNH